MKYTVERCIIRVIGPIWMPPGLVCAMDYTLTPYDLENLGEWTRENAERWLALNSGDFQGINDFEVDFDRGEESFHSPWNDPESECKYNDCMFPSED